MSKGVDWFAENHFFGMFEPSVAYLFVREAAFDFCLYLMYDCIMPVRESLLYWLKGKIRYKMDLINRCLLVWFGRYLSPRIRFNMMYSGTPPWDTGISPPELVAFMNNHPPGRAIDLGCGTGTNLIALGRAGWYVTGVDFARKAVRDAREKLEQAGITGEVRSGDVTDPEIVQGVYDLVLDIGCYHSLPPSDRKAYRQNLTHILSPNGHFLMYAHWHSEGQASDNGITDGDLNAFQEILRLEDRQDSQDRWGRFASWMRFCKMM